MKSPVPENSLDQRAGEVRSAALFILIASAPILAIGFSVVFTLSKDFPIALLSAVVLTAIITPVIYILFLRPLQMQEAARKRDRERLLALRQAVESMQIGVTVTDLEGRILYCNRAEAEMHGYTVEELMGMEARTLSLQENWRKPALDEIKNFKHWKRERVSVRKDGSSFPVQLTSNVVLNARGEPIGVITNCEDITERKSAELALQESEERYRSLVESTEDSIYVVDRDMKYLYVNKKHMKRLGAQEDEIIGMSHYDFHSADEIREFVEKVGRVFDTGNSTQHEHRSHRDGRYFLRTLSPIKEPSGEIVAVTVISKDITELKRLEEELRTLSLTDDLTGLYNRRGLMALGQQQLRMAHRLKKGLYILYADVDELKAINDSFGHKEGDRLLVMTANLLRNTFRSADIIARIGGDEFVCVLVATDETTSDTIRDRLVEGIDEFNSRRDISFKLSLSFGLSFYDPDSPRSLEELLIQADRSMYEWKSRKKA